MADINVSDAEAAAKAALLDRIKLKTDLADEAAEILMLAEAYAYTTGAGALPGGRSK